MPVALWKAESPVRVVPPQTNLPDEAGEKYTVVIYVHRIVGTAGVAIHQQGLGGRVNDVVFENIIRGIVLNLKFAAAGVVGVVAVERVVDDGAVISAAAVVPSPPMLMPMEFEA